MKIILSLLLLTAIAIAGNPRISSRAFTISKFPGIQFGENRQLSITVFSDLHFGEPMSARNRPNADIKTVGIMNSILDIEKPDLVVLNGDLTSCEWVAPENANKLIDQIVAPLAIRNLPFAATFGNHDASQTCDTRSMSEHMWWDFKGTNGKKLSFTTNSVKGEVSKVGWSNYFIPVYSSTDGNDLKMLLWFFDSKGGRIFQPGKGDVPVDNWVDEKVVKWFRQKSSQFRQQHNRVIPSMAFVHIPVHATYSFQQNDRTATNEPGLNEEFIGQQGDQCDSSGNHCTYNGADIPFMKALVGTEGLMAVFSGHDHGVDWCMKWSKFLPNTSPSNGNGLNLCFNRHSGYGGYADWARGARQIIVEEDKLGKDEVETWIRLEDGNISGRVTLNSTFGTDRYVEVDKFKTFRS
ncbi:Metallo-dependent phosphatase [Plenodomus tracheiphilus IPT5]|uniref:Metallo-dependent phosphatase n=1 Tax=Plenodomus tracheiphilus IPT5 TaxID=1408161 RepID=A0A6A7BFE9_9PLEO|nr:Metallo-dependent phosphatase [Plenodomus tracheiphilus IPT5]